MTAHSPTSPVQREQQAAKAFFQRDRQQSAAIDVWFACLANLPEDQRLLDKGERQRAARFISPAARHQFVCARAVMRQILGYYVAKRPVDLVFTTETFGRLFMNGEQLDFNLSHSGGWLVLAIGRGCRLGVDMDGYHTSSSNEAIVRQHFSLPEREAWLRADQANRPHVFAWIWTRKEASLKAVGVGLINELCLLDTTSDTSLQQSLSQLAARGGFPIELTLPVLATLHNLPSPHQYVASLMSIGPAVTPSVYFWNSHRTL